MNNPQTTSRFDEIKATKTYRVKDVVKLLHMKQSTVYDLVYKKQIPHIIIGCSIHFLKSDLVAWIDQRYQPGAH